MRSRRIAPLALALALGMASIALSPAPASAYPHFGELFQRTPVTNWAVPGAEPLDGIGVWVYVAPIPTAGPAQLPSDGYVYGLDFSAPRLPTEPGGLIGLSRDDQGPIAGIRLSTTVTIPYAWSPGNFYYLLVYQLGEGLWGGWVYDAASSTWTFIGASHTGAGPGLLNASWNSTRVHGAVGQPVAPFSQHGISPVVGCRSFPVVDAYFYPPVGYRGTTTTQSTLTETSPNIGDCPTEATVEQDWVHIHLGQAPR
jgi:hypothetical protein